MIKQSKKQLNYVYEAWTGDTCIYTLVVERLVCLPLFGIKRKTQKTNKLFGWQSFWRRRGRLLLVEKTLRTNEPLLRRLCNHRGPVNENVRNVCAFDYNARRMRHREEIVPTLRSLTPIKKKKHSLQKGSHKKNQSKTLVHKDTFSHEDDRSC